MLISSGVFAQDYSNPFINEYGFEFDKFIMTARRDYQADEGVGPAVKLKSGKLPKSTGMH